MKITITSVQDKAYLQDLMKLYPPVGEVMDVDMDILDRFEYESTKSKGLGDTVAKVIHTIKLDKVAKAYTRVTGKPCHCKERQQILNKILPYSK